MLKKVENFIFLDSVGSEVALLYYDRNIKKFKEDESLIQLEIKGKDKTLIEFFYKDL